MKPLLKRTEMFTEREETLTEVLNRLVSMKTKMSCLMKE